MLTSITSLLPMPSGAYLGSPTTRYELFGHKVIFCCGFTVHLTCTAEATLQLSKYEAQRQLYGWFLEKTISSFWNMGLCVSLNTFLQGWMSAGWKLHRVQPQNFIIHQPQGGNFNPLAKGTSRVHRAVRYSLGRKELDICFWIFFLSFLFLGSIFNAICHISAICLYSIHLLVSNERQHP